MVGLVSAGAPRSQPMVRRGVCHCRPQETQALLGERTSFWPESVAPDPGSIAAMAVGTPGSDGDAENPAGIGLLS
jgi:hypothetical protein